MANSKAAKAAEPANRNRVLFGILAVLAVVACVVWIRQLHPQKPPPDASNYYMGPMESKGKPGVLGNEDGTRVSGTSAGAPAAKGGPAQRGGAPGAGPQGSGAGAGPQGGM